MRYLGERAEYGTRQRAIPAMAVGFAALAGLFQLVSHDVMAVNFTTSDQQFEIYSNFMQGAYAASFVAPDHRGQYEADCSDTQNLQDCSFAQLGFRTAKLSGLCAIAHETIPLIGTISLVVTAGEPVQGAFSPTDPTPMNAAGQPVHLDAAGLMTGTSLSGAVTVADMYLNSNHITGNGTKISGLTLGQDASTMNATTGITWPTDDGGSTPPQSAFGLTAQQINIGSLSGGSYGINLAGTASLPGLRVTPVRDAGLGQSACPTYAPGA